MSLDTSARSLRRLAEQRLESLRCSASTFTTPLQKTSHMEMKRFLIGFYESIWTAEKRKFYDCEMQHYPRLKELYQELVVTQKKLTYEDFWQRYEYRCDMSRVIHGILHRDDPDVMKTVLDPSPIVSNDKSSQSSEGLHQVRTNIASSDRTPSNGTNQRSSSQFIRRPTVDTMERKMDNNDDTDSVVVNILDSPRLGEATRAGPDDNEGVLGTELVDSTNLCDAETTPSPSADDEIGHGKDVFNNRTDESITSTTYQLAGEVEEVNCEDMTLGGGKMSQDRLEDTFVSSLDVMGNASVTSILDETLPTTEISDSTGGLVELSSDSDAILEAKLSLLLSEGHEVIMGRSSLECSVNECQINKSLNPAVDAGTEEAPLTKQGKVKKNTSLVVSLMKFVLVIAILVASIVGLAAVVVVRDGLVAIDTLCAPIRPGLDVTLHDIGHAARFSAPWWAPEERKEAYFSVLCAQWGMVRSEVQVHWNVKKRFMGVSIVDLDKDQSLLTLKHLRSFQVLPETLQLRAETTRGRVLMHSAPWSSSHKVV